MSDTTPTNLGKIYALRREAILDVEGYRAFLKQEHPDIHDCLLDLDDVQLGMMMATVARILSTSGIPRATRRGVQAADESAARAERLLDHLHRHRERTAATLVEERTDLPPLAGPRST